MVLLLNFVSKKHENLHSAALGSQISRFILRHNLKVSH